VQERGYSIEYIQNPSEKIQLEAVRQNKSSFQYIKNPFKSVIEYMENH